MGRSAFRVGSRPDEGAPLERFKPTNGVVAGWAGVLLAVLTVGYVAVEEHSVPGLRVGLGAAFAGVLVWSTQIRPRATAYARSLVLHGTVTDTVVPYAAVDEVTMGRTLNVFVGAKRHVCVGIGRSMRDRTPPDRRAGIDYHDVVLDRVTSLVTVARAQPVSGPDPGQADRTTTPVGGVSRYVALPEVVALVGTGLAFAVSLLL